MAFSIKSIVLFLTLILPGTIYRRFFFQGEFTKQYGSKPWTISALYSIIPGTIIHLTLILCIHFTIGFEHVDLSPLTRFYEYFKVYCLKLELIDPIFILKILVYYLTSLVLAWLFALMSWGFVRGLKLDLKFKVFRFQNYWNYYFKGEILSFDEFKSIKKGKVYLVKADIIFNNEDGTNTLYTGDIRQYTINKDYSLQNIYLSNTKKYPNYKCGIESEEKEDEEKEKNEQEDNPKIRSIKGDCFIIPYKNILNINLKYFTASKSKISRKKDIIDSFLVFLHLTSILLIIFSNLSIFIQTTIVGTIFTKLYFIFYFFLWITLFSTFFKPNKKSYDKKMIESLEKNNDPFSKILSDNLKEQYKKEILKRKKKRRNARKGLLWIIGFLTLFIIFGFMDPDLFDIIIQNFNN